MADERRPAGIGVTPEPPRGTGIATGGASPRTEGAPSAGGYADLDPQNEPRRVSRELAQAVDAGSISSCEMLALIEPRALRGELTNAQVIDHVDRFLATLVKQETRVAHVKQLRQDFPRYKAWLDRLAVVRGSRDPSEQFRALALDEWQRRQFGELRAAARVHLLDGHLDWHEHQKMLRLASALGLTPKDVEQALAQAADGRSFTRDTVPPPGPVTGWKPLRELDPQATGLWDLEHLQDGIMLGFERAIELLKKDERRNDSLVGYLEPHPDAERAHAAALAARRWVLSEGLGETAVGVWQFLWSTGRPGLHLSLDGRPTHDARFIVHDRDELFRYAETVPTGLDVIGHLLAMACLERWLEIVAQAPEAARYARDYRRALPAPLGERAAAARDGALMALWGTGLRSLPLISDDGRSIVAVRSVSELIAQAEGGHHSAAYSSMVHRGALATWLSLVDPTRVASLQEAMKVGTLAPWQWLWANGSKRLWLGPGQPAVLSLNELLQATDSGSATLEDAVLTSGALELWLTAALQRPDLAQAAAAYRRDAEGFKAERWRQRAGAKVYRVAGFDASTDEEFAELALHAHAGSLSYADIDGALRSGLPQARFARDGSELGKLLETVAGLDATPEVRVKLACLAAGLSRLPLSDGGGVHTILSDLSDIERHLHDPGFRAALLDCLRWSVLPLWLSNVYPEPPPEVTELVARESSVAAGQPSLARGLACVDAVLRAVSGDFCCHLAPGLVPRTFPQLQALFRDYRAFSELADEIVRERVREACGAFGGVRILECQETGTLHENALANLAPLHAAHWFAWDWVHVPVLWLHEGRCVTTPSELLVALAEPSTRAAVAGAAQIGLLMDWLVRCHGMQPPVALLDDRRVPPENFPQLCLWLGDPAPRLTLSLAASKLNIQEGTHQTIPFTLKNEDAVRAAEVQLTARELLGLKVTFSRDTPVANARGAYQLAAGSTLTGSLLVQSVPGESGVKPVHLAAQLARVDGAPTTAAEAVCICTVQFPSGRSLRYGLVGLGLGLSTLLLVRASIGLLGGGNSADMLESSLFRRDSGMSKNVGSAVGVALIVGYRQWSTRGQRSLPTLRATRQALLAGFVALMIATPIGVVGGCIANYSKNMAQGMKDGLATGAFLALAFTVVMLARPGAAFREKAPKLHDFLFFAGALLVVLRPEALGDPVLAFQKAVDGAAIATATVFGVGGRSAGGHVLGGFAIWGAVMGCSLGLRRALVASGRPRLAWAQLLLLGASLSAIVIAGVTPGAVHYNTGPMADSSDCDAAVTHAASVLGAVSEDGVLEQVQAANLCRTLGTSKVHLACLNQASTASEIAACGPFWMRQTP